MTTNTTATTTAAYEHNGQPVSRQAFYAIACDPQRSVAVEACAGAGKTWMLVSRMLRALLDGAEPHEILAITFTKKAAGEMRQRLQEWLEDFADKPEHELEKELLARGVDALRVKEQAVALQTLYRKTLDSGRPVQIRTFHSWFAALLGTAPLQVLQDLGMPAHYELLENDAEAVREVWRPFLAAVAQDAALRADYERSIALHGRSQTHKALEAALSKRVEFTLADEAGVIDASVPHFTEQFPEFEGLDKPSDALATEAASARWHARSGSLGSESAKTPQKAADAVVDAFLQPDPDKRLALLRAAFFVAKEDRLTNHLRKFDVAQDAEVELQQLCAAQRQHTAWLYQQRVARLSRVLIAQFGALKRERGWIDMNDVERTAMKLLSDPILSGWVQERLDARVRHLLVDEFQDTNPLQWQSLHAWLSGYAGAGGGAGAPSVFIVGDPKQSIYRFRRAEPQVFIAAQTFVREGLEGDVLACDHTRRNAKGLIAAVNHVMQAAQTQQEYSGFRDHTTESTVPGMLWRLPKIADETGDDAAASANATEPAEWRDSLTVPRHEAEETLRMRESAQAAQWVVAQIRSGIPAREIMVLARKRARLAEMEAALRALHIPCVQPEKTELSEAPEVQDVIALMDALVSTAHDLSLARALKSPLFGVDDDALTEIALLRTEPEWAQSSWFDVVARGGERLSAPLQDAAARLNLYRGWVQSQPPHDALQAIYRHADVFARFAAASVVTQRDAVLANLRALLASALALDGGRYLTPYAFVRAMKRPGMQAPGRADLSAVRLLTVHGAKGLEAQCVLMLDTDAAGQKAETMGALVDWPGEHEYPQHFVFLASESSPPPSAEALLESELRERKREELNTLYVAMTRAKECFVISATQPGRAPASATWWARLEDCVVDLPAPEMAGAQVDASQSAVARILELPEYTAAQPDAQDGVTGTAATDALPQVTPSTPASRQGEAMHQLLEQAGVVGPTLAQLCASGWSDARVSRLAREFDLTAESAKNAASIAQRILQGEGAWAWDHSVIDRAMNEAPLVYQGQSLRLDRLVRRKATAERGAEWWVLDYKTAAAPQKQPQLIEQLQRYLRATTQQLGHEGAVHAAFLSGDGRLLEVRESGLLNEAASAKSAKPPARADNTGLASVPQPTLAAPEEPEQGSLF
ncbi:UvrD-helicase domain-containing protein [Diaphorobacter sp. HDW4A]|uniref:UvrD-helicase domain-containing protein n=1 Tax=Diaphorobacter sp. HDW4A TaxID=2714924 RepID=UPI001407812D|nr:UvrD-helicase domain-containing protein [Diaphorobacter sp. HDW4A]QIL79740.1 UvrD-helicase domain-containing protein [Diaphorobacter sp. HDW4A]